MEAQELATYRAAGLAIGGLMKKKGITVEQMGRLIRCSPSRIEQMVAGETTDIRLIVRAAPHVGKRLVLMDVRERPNGDLVARATRAGEGA